MVATPILRQVLSSAYRVAPVRFRGTALRPVPLRLRLYGRVKTYHHHWISESNYAQHVKIRVKLL